MQTSVTFMNLDPSETLKAYACEKLDRFDKYAENPAKANAVLTDAQTEKVNVLYRLKDGSYGLIQPSS